MRKNMVHEIKLWVSSNLYFESAARDGSLVRIDLNAINHFSGDPEEVEKEGAMRVEVKKANGMPAKDKAYREALEKLVERQCEVPFKISYQSPSDVNYFNASSFSSLGRVVFVEQSLESEDHYCFSIQW